MKKAQDRKTVQNFSGFVRDKSLNIQGLYFPQMHPSSLQWCGVLLLPPKEIGDPSPSVPCLDAGSSPGLFPLPSRLEAPAPPRPDQHRSPAPAPLGPQGPAPRCSSPGTLRAPWSGLGLWSEHGCSLVAGWSQRRPARRPAHPTKPREQVRALVCPADSKQHPMLLLLLSRPKQGQ